MGRRKRNVGLEAFNSAVVRDGITYADAQKLETYAEMKRIRAPRKVGDDGRPVYMTVAVMNQLKRLEAAGEGN